jgi:hypothetical protein
MEEAPKRQAVRTSTSTISDVQFEIYTAALSGNRPSQSEAEQRLDFLFCSAKRRFAVKFAEQPREFVRQGSLKLVLIHFAQLASYRVSDRCR